MRFALVCVLAVFVTLSCARSNSIALAQDDSGRSIATSVGDEIVVSLEGNPTTGFDWAVVGPIAPVLEQIDRTFTPQSSALGAGGTVRYRFRTAAAGTTTLTLVYSRSFESVPPQRTFTVTVVAK